MRQWKHGITTGLILVGGLILFVGFSKGLDTLAEQIESSDKAEQIDPSDQTEQIESSGKTEQIESSGKTEQIESSDQTEQIDYYQQALDYGWQAAVATQTAKTGQEWETVSSLWSQAIGKLQSVPENNPNYPTVRQKVLEYRTYRTYAQNQKQKSP